MNPELGSNTPSHPKPSQGTQRSSWECFGSKIWASLGLSGSLWGSQGLFGALWSSLELSGGLRGTLGLSGCSPTPNPHGKGGVKFYLFFKVLSLSPLCDNALRGTVPGVAIPGHQSQPRFGGIARPLRAPSEPPQSPLHPKSSFPRAHANTGDQQGDRVGSELHHSGQTGRTGRTGSTGSRQNWENWESWEYWEQREPREMG